MCDKIQFKTLAEANIIINIAKQTKARHSDIPKRSYYCKECNNFHLTKILKGEVKDRIMILENIKELKYKTNFKLIS